VRQGVGGGLRCWLDLLVDKSSRLSKSLFLFSLFLFFVCGGNRETGSPSRRRRCRTGAVDLSRVVENRFCSASPSLQTNSSLPLPTSPLLLPSQRTEAAQQPPRSTPSPSPLAHSALQHRDHLQLHLITLFTSSFSLALQQLSSVSATLPAQPAPLLTTLTTSFPFPSHQPTNVGSLLQPLPLRRVLFFPVLLPRTTIRPFTLPPKTRPALYLPSNGEEGE
jgi:hypothetical protein